jgi:hypothetical protein
VRVYSTVFVSPSQRALQFFHFVSLVTNRVPAPVYVSGVRLLIPNPAFSLPALYVSTRAFPLSGSIPSGILRSAFLRLSLLASHAFSFPASDSHALR